MFHEGDHMTSNTHRRLTADKIDELQAEVTGLQQQLILLDADNAALLQENSRLRNYVAELEHQVKATAQEVTQ